MRSEDLRYADAMDVALRIAVMETGTVHAAAQYVVETLSLALQPASAKVRKVASCAPHAEVDRQHAETRVRQQLERLLASIPASALQGLKESASKSAQQKHKTAKAFIRDQALLRWVRDVNMLGWAPTGRELLAAWEGHENPVPGSSSKHVVDAPPRPLTRRTQQQLRRWVRKHRLVRGRFPTGMRLPEETMQNKAGGRAEKRGLRARKSEALGPRFCRGPVPDSGREFEARFRPPKRAHTRSWHLKWRPDSGRLLPPISHPKTRPFRPP